MKATLRNFKFLKVAFTNMDFDLHGNPMGGLASSEWSERSLHIIE